MILGLEIILKMNGMTKSDLGKELNISRQAVDKWVNYKAKIPDERVIQIADMFEVPHRLVDQITEEESVILKLACVDHLYKNVMCELQKIKQNEFTNMINNSIIEKQESIKKLRE